MSEKEAEAVAKADAAWNGPKLIVLSAITLGIVLAVLFMSANRIIGPDFHEPPMSNY